MLSTNAYATNKSVLLVDDRILSLDSVFQNEIYLDYNLLMKSI